MAAVQEMGISLKNIGHYNKYQNKKRVNFICFHIDIAIYPTLVGLQVLIGRLDCLNMLLDFSGLRAAVCFPYFSR